MEIEINNDTANVNPGLGSGSSSFLADSATLLTTSSTKVKPLVVPPRPSLAAKAKQVEPKNNVSIDQNINTKENGSGKSNKEVPTNLTVQASEGINPMDTSNETSLTTNQDYSVGRSSGPRKEEQQQKEEMMIANSLRNSSLLSRIKWIVKQPTPGFYWEGPYFGFVPYSESTSNEGSRYTCCPDHSIFANFIDKESSIQLLYGPHGDRYDNLNSLVRMDHYMRSPVVPAVLKQLSNSNSKEVSQSIASKDFGRWALNIPKKEIETCLTYWARVIQSPSLFYLIESFKKIDSHLYEIEMECDEDCPFHPHNQIDQQTDSEEEQDFPLEIRVACGFFKMKKINSLVGPKMISSTNSMLFKYNIARIMDN